MIRTTCDGCNEDIERDGTWFGVNHWVPADDDDPDAFEARVLTEISTEDEYHFCSPGCLGAWALDKAVE